MLFETLGDRKNPAVLFFHAMGVTGESSERVAKELSDRYYCVLSTSTRESRSPHYDAFFVPVFEGYHLPNLPLLRK